MNKKGNKPVKILKCNNNIWVQKAWLITFWKNPYNMHTVQYCRHTFVEERGSCVVPCAYCMCLCKLLVVMELADKNVRTDQQKHWIIIPPSLPDSTMSLCGGLFNNKRWEQNRRKIYTVFKIMKNNDLTVYFVIIMDGFDLIKTKSCFAN